jgi:hypothetical protein
LDEIKVAHIHASATVTVKAHFIKGFSVGFAFAQQNFEFFPFVGNNGTTAKTSYWNNHDITSTVRLLLLAASTSAELVFGFLTTWVVNEKTAVEAQVLVTKFLVNTFCSAIVVDKATSDSGSDCVGLSHDSSTVGGDGNVNLAQAVHGVGNDQRLHGLAASK